MKVLIVCSQNSGKIAPFILEQAGNLSEAGVEISYFPIVGKGIVGYLRNRKALIAALKNFQPDLIHAHYGLSGLLANTQRKIPVITTYHGSDINSKQVFYFSKLNSLLSAYNIFVSENIFLKSGATKNSSVLACGINTDLFKPLEKSIARKTMGLDSDKKYILFSGAFSDPVKNSTLAKSAVKLLADVELLELKGYTRAGVATLLNAVDALLMTSFTEGSPQIIKEALACNCPVVSVAAGDVPFLIAKVGGCYTANSDAAELAGQLELALLSGRLMDGRSRIFELQLDGKDVAAQLLSLYATVVSAGAANK